MDNKEIRAELGKIVGRFHRAAGDLAIASGERPEMMLKAEGYNECAVEIMLLMRRIDRDEDRSLMDQAQYERSEKDCMWERD